MIIPFPNYLKCRHGVFDCCRKYETVDDVLKERGSVVIETVT